MNLAAVGSSVSLDSPNNPGPVVFYARIGSPSPADPNIEQLVTDRPPSDWMSTIQNAASASLSLFTGANTQAAKSLTGAASTTVKKAGYEAQKISGRAGVAYYSTVASLNNAVASTAGAAQSVVKKISWGTTAIVIIVAVVLFAQFRIAAGKS